MRRKSALILLIILGLVAFYFSGPRPGPLVLNPTLSNDLPSLYEIENLLAQREAKFSLRKDNEARIVWADSIRKTDWVILYLHGFSASQGEGAPVHQNLAKRYGANLLLARLSGHGYQADQLSDFQAESAWEDAKRFLQFAKVLGQRVILMGTSTGSSFALNLAAKYPDMVDGIVNLSPNVRVKDPTARLLNDPWGLQIAKMVIGEKRRVVSDSIEYAKYWDTLYTVQALVELEHLLEESLIPETFSAVKQPCLNLCYYKSEEEQDQVVSVEHIEWMHEELGTQISEKQLVKLPKVGNHVLASPIKSKDIVGTQKAIERFMEDVLKIAPLE